MNIQKVIGGVLSSLSASPMQTIRQTFREESRTSGREPLILSAALEADIEDARIYYQIKNIGRSDKRFPYALNLYITV